MGFAEASAGDEGDHQVYAKEVADKKVIEVLFLKVRAPCACHRQGEMAGELAAMPQASTPQNSWRELKMCAKFIAWQPCISSSRYIAKSKQQGIIVEVTSPSSRPGLAAITLDHLADSILPLRS